MISNPRCLANGDKIYVRWNYEDVERKVTSTCELRKCLNDEVVDIHSHINLASFLSSMGGCIFDMPRYPVKVVLWDDEDPNDKIELDVPESPRYHVTYKVVGPELHVIEERKKLFKKPKRTAVVSMRLRLMLPEEDVLSQDEAARIPGWALCGYRREGDSETRFFWPKAFKLGLNTLTDPLDGGDQAPEASVELARYELDPDDNRPKVPQRYVDAFRFGVDPSVEATRYGGLFEVSRLVNETLNGQVGPLGGEKEPDSSFHDVDIHHKVRLHESVCPHCLESFNYNEPLFRASIDPTNPGYDEAVDDDCYREFEKSVGVRSGQERLGKVLHWRGSDITAFRLAGQEDFVRRDEEATVVGDRVLPNGVVVEVEYGPRHDRTSEKICPHCHHRIPLMMGYYPALSVTMMGNTGSGKTVYMARLVQQLKHQRLLPGYRFVCTPCNENSREMFDEYERIEGSKVEQTEAKSSARDKEALPEELDLNAVLPASRSVGDDVRGGSRGAEIEDTMRLFDATPMAYRPPYIYELESSAAEDTDETFQGRGDRDGLIFVLYDFPGEAVWRKDQNAEFRNRFKRVLDSVDGIVFLFDPMTIGRVLNMGPEKRHMFARFLTAEEDVMAQDFFRDAPSKILAALKDNYMPAKKVSVPVVFAISKADSLRDHLLEVDGGQQLGDTSFLEEDDKSTLVDRRGIDLERIEVNSRLIEEFMQDPGLVSAAKMFAPDSVWMCVSATGVAPVAGSMQGRYAGPLHVVDPIEWILYRQVGVGE